MAKSISISDDLAALLERRRKTSGWPSINAAAEALIAQALVNAPDEDHSAGRDDAALRALIDEADASGPASPWNGADARTEALKRYAARIRA